ncbi:MAG: class I SAM-dependent methyltransferase [Nitrososphaerales archaeon]
MVVYRSELTSNLTKFYDFKGKAVLYVGAGGGQLLDPASGPGRMVAIDKDTKSLDGFRSEARSKWAGIPISFVPREFENVDQKGDVVYFEFCLYQMKDPREALEHARSLAPDIVVMDHLPGSEWVYYWAGEDLVLKSTKVVESFGVRSSSRFIAEHRFQDYEALAARLRGVGKVSRRRVLELRGAKDIRMRMTYGLFLL